MKYQIINSMLYKVSLDNSVKILVADLIPISLFANEYEASFVDDKLEAEFHGFAGELSTLETLELLAMEGNEDGIIINA